MDPTLKHLFLLYHGGQATPRDFKDLAVGLVEGGAKEPDLVELAYVCEDTVDDTTGPIERLLANSEFNPPDSPIELVRELFTYYILKIASATIKPLEGLQLIQENVVVPFADLVGNGDPFGVRRLLECHDRLQHQQVSHTTEQSRGICDQGFHVSIGDQIVEECLRWGDGKGVSNTSEADLLPDPSPSLDGSSYFAPDGSSAQDYPGPIISSSHTEDPFKRPLGITLVAGLLLMHGLSIFIDLVYPTITWQGVEIFSTAQVPLDRTYLEITKIVISFAMGAGLLAGHRWSWWGCAGYGVLLVSSLLYLSFGEKMDTWGMMILLLFGSGIAYMFMPNVMIFFFQDFQKRWNRLGILVAVDAFLILLLYLLSR